VARVDYDRQAEQYHMGRAVPLSDLGAWREAISRFVAPETPAPLLDVGAGTGIWTRALGTWFEKPVIAVEPSEGMRRVALAQGLAPATWFVAGRGEAVPLGDETCSMAWLSTVVHHLVDLGQAAKELRRVLVDGGPVLMRNSFAHRHEEIPLFRYFDAARRVANLFPTVEEIVNAFSSTGFEMVDLVRVHEPPFPSLQAFRDWAVSMRHTDSALAPLSDDEFALGLGALDGAIAQGELPTLWGSTSWSWRSRSGVWGPSTRPTRKESAHVFMSRADATR